MTARVRNVGYKGVVGDIWSGFGLAGKVNLKNWWREQEDISLLQKLSRFISEILLVEFPSERLFVFIDEIDNILSLDFSVDDFFALIRYCYNQRAINPEYERITFAIFGVATPTDLIQNKNTTPFNIGKSIELKGFTLDECLYLAQGLNLENIEYSQAILREILKWTGGQPFLTQKICHLVAAKAREQEDEGKHYTTKPQNLVSDTVESLVIERWESQDEPLHLRTIRDRILNNDAIVAGLLGIYQQILLEKEVIADDSKEKVELLLSGLVINHGEKLKVKNIIYQIIFSLKWIAKQLDRLRPYSKNLNAWIDSGQQDKSQLLRGVQLQQAVNWSENKRLLDIDYRFIAASQELIKQEIIRDLNTEKIEKQKAKFALQLAGEASKILGNARKYAKRNVKRIRLGKRWILGISISVTLIVLILRSTGLLQQAEWNMLDRFIQNRPSEGIDPRIVIITIDEPDLQQIGQYPIPDKVLAEALNKLKSYKPRNIGLDLYRDLPVNPGYEELTQVFRTTPNLIGIEKFVGSKVPPPKVLAELGQVGLADQVLDGDGKVRRALLSVGSSKTKLRNNLSVELAFDYLRAEGITPKSLPNNSHHKQLGKTVLIPFKANDGGYVNADAGGYQILLNYHGTRKDFLSFSITDLLNDRIPLRAVKNRIVLTLFYHFREIINSG